MVITRFYFPTLLLLSLWSSPSWSTEEPNAYTPTMLTPENFAQQTHGRNVFLKFFDPNCPHCRDMAPAWEQLEKAWQHHHQVLVASIDCRASLATERWCETTMNVRGFPTLLYGEPSHQGAYLESYGDDKTFVALHTFVENSLATEPICSPGNIEACDVSAQEKLQGYWKLSVSQLEQEIAATTADIKAIHRQFQEDFAILQQAYDQQAAAHELEKARIASEIALIQSVVAVTKA